MIGLTKSGTGPLRLPLDFAVAVSPAVLFAPHLLHRTTGITRQFLVQASFSLYPLRRVV
jgi:hypothetical protein